MRKKQATKKFLTDLLDSSLKDEHQSYAVIDSFYGLSTTAPIHKHNKSEILGFVLNDLSQMENADKTSMVKDILNAYAEKYVDDAERTCAIASVTHLIECINFNEHLLGIQNLSYQVDLQTQQLLGEVKSEKGEINKIQVALLDLMDKVETSIKQAVDVEKQLKKAVKKFNSDYKKYNTRFEEADAQLKQTQTSFVSILGIFSSITFGLFGGLNLLSSVFTRAVNVTNKFSLLVMVIAGLFILLALLIMLGYLLSIVAKIIGKKDVIPTYTTWMIGSLLLVVIVLSLIYWCNGPSENPKIENTTTQPSSK